MKPREKVTNPRANKQGVSLIELMITAIIIAIIALAGGAVIHLSRSALATQRDKHAALTEAIRIMELARIAIDLRGENGPFFEGANGLTGSWELIASYAPVSEPREETFSPQVEAAKTYFRLRMRLP